MIKTIIFDYDGTLHNSSKIYCKAFYEVQEYFVAKKYMEHKKYSYDDVIKWLGITPEEMWDDFAPNLSNELKQLGTAMIGNRMNDLIEETELYEGSTYMLSNLREKANLILLSNCTKRYMQNHIRRFKLDKYFKDYYCAEDYGYIPKYQIFKHITNKYEGEYIVVGDRYKDIEIKHYYKVWTVGCLYGYGRDELIQADYVAESIKELKTIITKLIRLEYTDIPVIF